MRVSIARCALVATRPQPLLAAGRHIARLAVRSLHAELVLYPKPGLVSLHDNGAHRDMNAGTFVRSLFALRHYFAAIAVAGMRGASMPELRQLGVAAEARMMAATRGVNTHRGAIFALGLISAAAGRVWAERGPWSDAALRDMLARSWRRGLLAVPALSAPSHGQQVAARYGAAGARGEAIRGFPAVFEVALPALRDALARGADGERARLHAFFALLAAVDDTNVLYRGGRAALDQMQQGAAQFLAAGSVFADDWLQRAETLHRRCSRQRLSPGGCADLLAAAWFVHQLQTRVQ
jgi:triphosphoribosyl-dephospho-CoA synthase